MVKILDNSIPGGSKMIFFRINIDRISLIYSPKKVNCILVSILLICVLPDQASASNSSEHNNKLLAPEYPTKREKYYPYFAGLDEKNNTEIIYSAPLKYLEEYLNKDGKIESFAIYPVIKSRTPHNKRSNSKIEEKENNSYKESYIINKKIEATIENNIAYSFSLKIEGDPSNLISKKTTGIITINNKICSLSFCKKSIIEHTDNHKTHLFIMEYKNMENIIESASNIFKQTKNIDLFFILIIPQNTQTTIKENIITIHK